MKNSLKDMDSKMINSEEEYWKEFDLFKKQLKKSKTLEELNKIFKDAELKGLFTKEQTINFKNKFESEIEMAKKDKLSWIKDQIKQRLKY